MKTPEEYARELDFALAHSGERPDEAMARKIRQAMADENERCARLLVEAAATRRSVAGPQLASSFEAERGAASIMMIVAHELDEQAKRIRALLAPATPVRQDELVCSGEPRCKRGLGCLCYPCEKVPRQGGES